MTWANAKIKRIMIWDKQVRPARLPSAYQEVEYIQSSWTQYIDTWVYVNPDYKVEIKYQNVTFISYGTLFGTRNWTNARFLLRYSTDAQVVTAQRSTAYNVSTESYDNSSYYDHNTRIVKLDRYFYIDNNLLKTFSASTSTTAFPYSLYLFSLNSQWSPVDYGVYKIYYCKIYNNLWTLVRDFIPCYRKSDNVIWLYDLVNNQFYTNSWSWTFTKWPDVN
jgi:hypothetical protein